MNLCEDHGPGDGLPPQWAKIIPDHSASVVCGSDGSIERLDLDDCRQIGLFPDLQETEEAIGKTFAALLPESDLGRGLDRALAVDSPVNKFVAWYNSKPDERRWVVFDVAAAGGPTGARTVALWDVTDFMRADIRRRCRTSRDERIFYDGVRNSVTIHDDAGTILGVNQACADTLGYSLEEAHRLHLHDYVVGYTQEGLDKYWARVANGELDYPAGMYKLQDGWVATSVRLHSILLNYGTRSFMRTTSVTFEDNMDHRERVSQGLSKVLQLTDKLIESPDVDSLCLEAVRLGLTAIGLDRCSLYLVTEGKVHGTWGTDGIGGAADERHICFALDDKWRRLARKEGLYASNSDVVWDADLTSWANGEARACTKGWLASTPIMSGERFLGVFFNDSARSKEQYNPAKQRVVEVYCLLLGSLIAMKRAEKARARVEEQFRGSERLQALGRLAGDIAHDVNDLVGPVAPLPDEMLERLQHLAADPGAEAGFFIDALTQIDEAADGAAALVREAISLGREGRLELGELDIVQILQSYTESPPFRKLLSSRPGIELTVSIPDHPLIVNGSDAHLRRAFAQVVTNAVEAMGDNGSLKIGAFMEGEPGAGSAYIEIADTGCGISDEHRPRVFEPYFSTKTDTHSSAAGLSLAIVYDIVRQHDGDIEVQSEEGKGTRFVLSFPLLDKTP